MALGTPVPNPRAQLLGALQHAVTASGAVDPVAVGRLVVDHLRDYLGVDAAAISWSDPAGPGARVLAHNFPDFPDPAPPISPDRGALGRAHATGQVVEVEDYPSWEHADPRAIEAGLVSCVAAPLLVGGAAIGALAVMSRRARKLERAEVQWLALISAQIGLVLQTARLHQEAERHRAEVARSAQRIRSIYEGIACGIVVRDAAGAIVHVNAVAEEILGRSAQELIGTSTEAAFAAYTERGAPLSPSEWPSVVALRTGQTVRNVVLGFDQPSGERRWIQASAIPLRGPDERPIEVVLSFVDVTARKETERTLHNLAQTEKLRAIGQMAGGVAHDINQYLGLITGHGDLALRSLDGGTADPDWLRQSIQTIIQAATDGSATVNRLLTFARPRAGSVGEPVDLGHLLADVADLTAPRWRDAAQADGLPVTLEIAVEGDSRVDGSPEALREALTNLIFNAVDAMPRGGAIRLAARRRGDIVDVEVSDTGSGIDEEIRNRIFEPFFTTKGDRGSGLGLPVVFAIVEQHHGHVTVDSAPGRGTTFRLIFPASTAPAPPPEPAPPVPTTLRILAVDDDPALAKMIALMLRAEGHQVELASSGEEALRRLDETRFDLVISDLGMGSGMNGWELARSVRDDHPGVRFCLSTGWDTRVDPARARENGVSAVISKPYRLADLKRILTGS